VLQCVAVCCNALQRVAACCSVLQYCDDTGGDDWEPYFDPRDQVCCGALQCVAVSCSVVQCVAVS